jgi:hypothetical protein
LYSGAFNITTGETIKALSVGSPYANSAVGTQTYSQQTTPSFSPVAGSYGPTQNVAITSAAATEVYYEVGSSPYPGHETLYTTQVSVAVSETVYARAARTGYVNSVVSNAVYTINGAVATPTFIPVAGAYNFAQSVAVSDVNSGLSGFAMYYTLDGSTPTVGSTLYTGAITVGTSETIKVLAVATGYSNSAVGSAAYTISLGPGVYVISGRVKGTRVYEGGNVLTTPPTFGNVVNWAPVPAHFGDVDNAPVDNSNPVSWAPTPPHFCNKLPETGVTVTLSGAASGSTTTDQFGNYSFGSLASGTYTVTPSQTGYTFAPLSRTFTINDSVNGINFTSD